MELHRQQMSGGTATTYELPRLVVHGSVVERTQANLIGTVTDRSFPAGTPISHLTFST